MKRFAPFFFFLLVVAALGMAAPPPPPPAFDTTHTMGDFSSETDWLGPMGERAASRDRDLVNAKARVVTARKARNNAARRYNRGAVKAGHTAYGGSFTGASIASVTVTYVLDGDGEPVQPLEVATVRLQGD